MADRLLAEFATEHALAAAIRELYAKGYRELEAYVPFASHEVEEALARPPSRLPIAIFVIGIGAAGGAYLLQWLLVAYLYPLDVGGRPPHFPLAFVIITFEMGVLFAAFTAFFGTLVLGRLVRLTDDIQGTPGFESVTRDRWWLAVARRRGVLEEDPTSPLLVELGALRVERPGGWS